MLRGLAIVFVVVNHVGINSVFQLLSQETLGVVSGAELFVMLSGVVLGMVYGPRIATELGDVVDGTTKRAWKLYFTALAVVLIVYGLSLLPFINAAAVTTFTDQGTGGAGRAAAGTTYDLYAGMEGVAAVPPRPARAHPGAPVAAGWAVAVQHHGPLRRSVAHQPANPRCAFPRVYLAGPHAQRRPLHRGVDLPFPPAAFAVRGFIPASRVAAPVRCGNDRRVLSTSDHPVVCRSPVGACCLGGCAFSWQQPVPSSPGAALI